MECVTNLKARAQTWSNYKYHLVSNSHFSIGCNYIHFKGMGRPCVRLHITEHCGLLDKLMPGDLVC